MCGTVKKKGLRGGGWVGYNLCAIFTIIFGKYQINLNSFCDGHTCS